jgi:hypothetical protein
MSLPACQERILSGIETALRAAEPRMASRFTIFTRLTRDEARWATCTANGVVVQGPHSTGHKSATGGTSHS